MSMDPEKFQFHTKKVDQIVRRELVNAKKWEKAVDENSQQIRLLNITEDFDCDKAILIHKAPYREKSESSFQLKVVQDDLEKQVSKLDDLAVDIFDVVLYKCLLSHRFGKQKVIIYADDICALRGLKPRGGSFETKVKKIIEERMLALTNIHIQVDGYTIWTKDKKGKVRKTIANYKSPIFLISGFKEEKLFSDDNKKVVEHRYAWEVTPGALLSAIADSLSKPQYLYMPTKVLAYDPKYFANVKRLAKAIYYYFRVKIDAYMKGYKKSDKGDQAPLLPISVENLLKTAGIPLPHAKKRLSFKRSFDKWLDKLEEDRVIKTYEYNNDLLLLPEGQWFDVWLSSGICIYATDELINLYSQNKETKKSKVKDFEESFIDESLVIDIVAEMRSFRDEKALTIRELAAKIQIAPSTISMFLTGQRNPSKKMAVRISEALAN